MQFSCCNHLKTLLLSNNNSNNNRNTAPKEYQSHLCSRCVIFHRQELEMIRRAKSSSLENIITSSQGLVSPFLRQHFVTLVLCPTLGGIFSNLASFASPTICLSWRLLTLPWPPLATSYIQRCFDLGYLLRDIKMCKRDTYGKREREKSIYISPFQFDRRR